MVVENIYLLKIVNFLNAFTFSVCTVHCTLCSFFNDDVLERTNTFDIYHTISVNTMTEFASD